MVDALKPYPEYKPSRLPWLKQIPAHWDENRAKCYFREVDDRSASGDEELLSVSHITGVTPRSQKNVTMFKAESYVGHKLCQPGDLVVNTMWAWMAAMGVAKQIGLVSPSYATYRPRSGDAYIPEFVDALLRTSPYRSEYVCRSTGIRASRLRLYPEKFLEIPIVCPPRDEQAVIAGYVAQVSARVAKYVRTKRRQVELLDFQKQGIVHRALTAGVNSTDGRKRSGIPWLQEVPRHWDILLLQRRYSVDLGKMLDAKRITGKYLVPYLRNTDVQWDRINSIELPAMDIGPQEYGRYTVRAGDLLVCEGGDVGRCAFWEGQLPLCGYQKALHRLRPIDSTRDNPRFLFYLMYCASKQGVFRADGSENTIPHLTREKLCRYRFVFPPRKEQDTICFMLADELRCIEAAITNANRQIELVRKYRNLLISDVLVGKLDARAVETTCEPETDVAIAEELEVAEAEDDAMVEAAVGDE